MIGLEVKRTTWDQVCARQNAESVIVIPLGGEAKEHGLHLPLNNDFIMAEHFKNKVLELRDVIVYPTINYSYYPAFVDYPGSTHLGLETTVQVIADIVRSIAKHGPKKFYVLNTGISTLKPLAKAKDLLTQEGLTFRYSNINLFKAAVKLEQKGGSHADEGETSLMLAIAPTIVDLQRAKPDYRESEGPLSPTEQPGKTYSPTGAWGDPTKATLEKGRLIEEAYLKGFLADIDEIKKAL